MRFVYNTGLGRRVFRNVRMVGSWDGNGRATDAMSTVVPMREMVGQDGAFTYLADVTLSPADVGRRFRWSVLVDGPAGLDQCGMPTEQLGRGSESTYKTFDLTDPNALEVYYLTHIRRLGAQKRWLERGRDPGIRFSVWAPHARRVEVVFATPSCGYIADDGTGLDGDRPPIEMQRRPSGVWVADATTDERLARFSDWVAVPYMFRIQKEDGEVAYRTDLYSRAQLGRGETNPHGAVYEGGPDDLDGSVSCSLVVDTDKVSTRDVSVPQGSADANGAETVVSEDEFWQDEFRHSLPVPQRLQDLVIYELHVGSLGFGQDRPGNLQDAIALLDYLADLGINAVELLPIAEFNGTRTWGYGNSHHFAIQSSAGGRDQFRRFVRECHRRGIAVIVDVVYNHFVHDGERAEWHYDSDRENHNIYYWYEGKPEDYPTPDGGYLDNMSTGFAPRLWDENVRKLFISSAVALVEGFHVDGFRVDQTTSLHAYNVLHADGRQIGAANQAGAQFLRELGRTLRLTRPSTLLIAEDHSDWPMVGEPAEVGGLGFDGFWYAAFYHHLVGDTATGPEYAKLLATAAKGDGDLAIDYFAGALAASGRKAIVYHESHDEAGNSELSRRTLAVAANVPPGEPPPTGELRLIAEARCRVVAGLSLMSAGTPMFLMGEEIGAFKDFRYHDFIHNREDLHGEREREGRRLFRFYRDLIRLRLAHPAICTQNIEIVYTHNSDRVLAFHRWNGAEEYLVIATLSDVGWPDGYAVVNDALPAAAWRQVFTSDREVYGGTRRDLGSAPLHSEDGRFVVPLPPRTLLVLRRLVD